MNNNITEKDNNAVINFLKSNPILTNNKKVLEFEKKWSKWLGVKYSVFVNSGSSANLLSISYLKMTRKKGEIIVPAVTWVSDINSILYNGFTPVFVDINLNNLSANYNSIKKSINKNTVGIFLTHALGFNALSDKLLKLIKKKNLILIEDVAEAHGAKYKNKKLGNYGKISNFSFYYAHHMSTVEGGMVCTNDKKIYDSIRVMRSHGMIRESSDLGKKQKYIKKFSNLNKDFIFAYPGYNVRSTEINAIIGLSQLKSLDKNIKKRNLNHKIFLDRIDSKKFFTDFVLKGSSNYAFNLILKKPDPEYANRLAIGMKKMGIEFRRGSAGGGNQLRQPYLRNIIDKKLYKNFPITDHVHFYGFYIGNYPDLKKKDVINICKLINSIN